jgi:hypothetical protein
MVTEKSLFLFGDSFTNHSYGESSEEIRNNIIQWGTIVSNTLKCNLQNFGEVSFSNPQIIATITENLWRIKPGDYIVIGLSTPFRTITVRNNQIRSFLIQDYIHSTLPEEKYVFDYVQNIIYPNEPLFEEFYWNQIKGIKKLLDNHGCVTYLWDSKLWEKFESVKKQTKGKDKDPHWSKKGHEDMAKYILEKLNKKSKNII